MASIEELRKEIRANHVAPLWEFAAGLFTREPSPPVRPFLWKGKAIISLLRAASETVEIKAEVGRRVLTLIHPDARLYGGANWNMQVGSYWFESADFIYRCGSINGFQARLDPSGRFIGVIAHHDPGVWNWLDTAGLRIVPATYRWQLVRGPREAVPTPEARIVRVDRLDDELSPTTPRITPSERADQLARRRRGALRRYGR